jgi:hypothetical protein
MNAVCNIQTLIAVFRDQMCSFLAHSHGTLQFILTKAMHI